jgi:hypothetical protein
MLSRLGNPTPIDHPLRELVKLAAEARAWQEILRERVAELSSISSFDSKGTEQERAVIALYERSLDRLARFLSELARLDLGGRLVELEEGQARLIVSLVRRILHNEALGLSVEQLEIANHLAAAELRTLDSENR